MKCGNNKGSIFGARWSNWVSEVGFFCQLFPLLVRLCYIGDLLNLGKSFARVGW